MIWVSIWNIAYCKRHALEFCHFDRTCLSLRLSGSCNCNFSCNLHWQILSQDSRPVSSFTQLRKFAVGCILFTILPEFNSLIRFIYHCVGHQYVSVTGFFDSDSIYMVLHLWTSVFFNAFFSPFYYFFSCRKIRNFRKGELWGWNRGRKSKGNNNSQTTKSHLNDYMNIAYYCITCVNLNYLFGCVS